MEEKGLHNNYIFTIVKLILFLLIFCFLVSLSREFLKEVRAEKNMRLTLLSFSILSCFLFYTFFVDLNNLYKSIQKFFFHNQFFSLLVPSFFILLGLGFFLIPKVFNFNFDRNIFLFSGGFVLASHMIFISRELKGSNFASFINYLFIFGILYILNLMLFSLYLNIAFHIDLGKIIVNGGKSGAILIKSMAMQIFRT